MESDTSLLDAANRSHQIIAEAAQSYALRSELSRTRLRLKGLTVLMASSVEAPTYHQVREMLEKIVKDLDAATGP
jgi:hypothetical protein